jgi:hypothetical protein
MSGFKPGAKCIVTPHMPCGWMFKPFAGRIVTLVCELDQPQVCGMPWIVQEKLVHQIDTHFELAIDFIARCHLTPLPGEDDVREYDEKMSDESTRPLSAPEEADEWAKVTFNRSSS